MEVRESIIRRFNCWSFFLYDSQFVSQFEQIDFDNVRINAARNSLAFGHVGKLLCFVIPQQWNFNTPLQVNSVDNFTDDFQLWDHVVEFDLDVLSGKITLLSSDSGRQMEFDIPAGEYRMRVSSVWLDSSYENTEFETILPHEYRFEYIPRLSDGIDIEHIRWLGYDKFGIR